MGTGLVRNTCRFFGFDGIADRIDDFWGGNRSTSENISATREYNENTATVNEFEILSKELDSWKADIATKAKDIELKIYKDCYEILNNFREQVKELNQVKFGDKNLNVNIKRIEKTIHNLNKEIQSTMKIYLLDKVSLDNKECKDILSMKQGKAKKNSMNDFLDKNLKNALKSLDKKIKSLLSDELEFLKEDMKLKLDTIKASNDEKIKFFEEFKNKNEYKIKEKEEKEKEYKLKLKLNDLIINNL